MKKKLNILITSPSIEIGKNVGGIVNHTRLLINNNNDVIYHHFVVGKSDSKKRNLMLVMLGLCHSS